MYILIKTGEPQRLSERERERAITEVTYPQATYDITEEHIPLMEAESIVDHYTSLLSFQHIISMARTGKSTVCKHAGIGNGAHL